MVGLILLDIYRYEVGDGTIFGVRMIPRKIDSRSFFLFEEPRIKTLLQ